ncbi:MAG: hypothetical protein ACPG19_04350, partial [Saprospiraceae bacterium]
TPTLEKLRVRNSKFQSCQNLEFSSEEMARLAVIQNELVRLISPATPYTLLYLQTDSETSFSSLQVFGSVPLVRRMMFMAFVSLVLLLSFAFLPNSQEIIQSNLLDNQDFDLVFAVLFRLAAAGMGASFYALYKVKNYVGNNTFDPAYEATYWTEFVLGLMSGLIFSTFLDGQDISAGLNGNGSKMLGTIIVALLGGFASNVVYEFLNSMVNALASIFKPDMKKVLATEIDKVKANIRANANEMIADKKQSLIGHLHDLQSDIFNGNFSTEDISDRLGGLVKDLTSLDKASEHAPKTIKTTTNTVTTNPSIEKPKTNTNVNIPKDVPSSNNVITNVENVHPMSVSAIHQDDINEATEDEYVDIFDTRA